MKFCPQCRAQYEDETNFCLQDGTPTVEFLLSRQPTENYSAETIALPKPSIPPTQVVPLTNPQNAVPVSVETRILPTSPQYQNAPRKSNTGLLVALLFGGLLFVGAAAGGLLYLRNQYTDELAAVNSDKTDQTVSPDNDSNSYISNTAETKANSINSVKPSPTENLNIVKITPSPETIDTRTDIIEDLDEPPTSQTPKPVPKTVSGGVVNGKARNLVKPIYPASARAVKASGAVNVQVLIDENGNVISASAVSGHPLLRSSAVQAARASTFNPTVLSGQPVKVTGVIVYNFVAPE